MEQVRHHYTQAIGGLIMSDSVHLRFDSVSDFGQYLKSLGERTSGALDQSEKWDNYACNDFTLTQSIDCAIRGGAWQQGAQDLANVTFEHDAQFESELRTFESAPVGFMPNVPSAINGLPDSMFAMRKERAPSKLIKIGVHNSISHKVSPEQALNRGRALLAVIERLELMGYCVELWAISNCKGGSTYHQFLVETRVKAGNESPNMPAMAFAFCSTLFTRRLIFRAIESAPFARELTEDAYGYPLDLIGQPRAAYNVYFPPLFSDEYQWRTPESARNHILKSITQQLQDC